MLTFPGYSTFEAIGKLTKDQVAWLIAGLNWRTEEQRRRSKRSR